MRSFTTQSHNFQVHVLVLVSDITWLDSTRSVFVCSIFGEQLKSVSVKNSPKYLENFYFVSPRDSFVWVFLAYMRRTVWPLLLAHVQRSKMEIITITLNHLVAMRTTQPRVSPPTCIAALLAVAYQNSHLKHASKLLYGIFLNAIKNSTAQKYSEINKSEHQNSKKKTNTKTDITCSEQPTKWKKLRSRWVVRDTTHHNAFENVSCNYNVSVCSHKIIIVVMHIVWM